MAGSSKIDAQGVAELAALAKLRLEPAERDRLIAKLGTLLDHFAALEQLATDEVEPSPYPMALPARMRADEPGEPLSQADVLANAPDARAGQFEVPRVVEG